MAMLRVLSLLALVASNGCSRASEPERPRERGQLSVAPRHDEAPIAVTEHPDPATSATTSPVLPPLRGEWLEHLGSEAEPVLVTPPLGAVEPRPLVVGVHGAGDRPDWACGGWRLAAQAGAFVVCPQGSPMPGHSFGWSSPQALARSVERAIDVARQRYGAHVATGSVIYAGFSQGATFAEPLLRKHAARFPIAILAEGGYQTSRDPSFARAYREAGGRRIALVCGSRACFKSASFAKKVLESAGIEALVIGDELAGHNLNQRMQRALERAWNDISAPLPG
jgi:predicted esterase